MAQNFRSSFPAPSWPRSRKIASLDDSAETATTEIVDSREKAIWGIGKCGGRRGIKVAALQRARGKGVRSCEKQRRIFRRAVRMNFLKYRNPGDNMRLWRVYANSVLQYGTVKKIKNAINTEISYRRRDVFVKSKPYILFVEPLYYCNLQCPLCDRQVFSEARDRDAGKLSLPIYDRVLNELGDYLFQCQIFGRANR